MTKEQKQKMIADTKLGILKKLTTLFEYENVPEGLETEVLEHYLLTRGKIAIDKNFNPYIINAINDNAYSTYFPNSYEATQINTFQPNNKKIMRTDKHYVVARNDLYMMGLNSVIDEYSNFVVDSKITSKMLLINQRAPYLLHADSDDGKKSADLFLDKLERGEMHVVASNSFFSESGVTSVMLSNGQQNQVKNFIELCQYIKADFYETEFGANINENMKRSYISDNEQETKKGIGLMALQNMLKYRKEMCETMNNNFGINISVDINPLWYEELKKEEMEGGENNDNTEDSGRDINN